MQTKILNQDDSQLSDRAIVSRVLAGERHLFELLMRRYNQRFFRLARAYIKDPDEAEDVVQEAYIRAYSNLTQFSGDSFGAWAARIAVNEALGRLRRNTPLRLADEVPQEPGIESEAKDCAPDQLAGRDQMLTFIAVAVDRLPQDFRAVFMLRSVEQLSVEETARYLNIPCATVKTRLFRANALLQSRLSRYLADVSGDAFSFGGVRCDRIVTHVLVRLSGGSGG